MAKKANDAEMEKRVTAVFKLILRGAQRPAILEFAQKQAWDVSPRQIDTYARKANALFRAMAEADRELELGLAVAQLYDLYAGALSIQDRATALNARKELNKLKGLYPPEPPKTLRILNLTEETANRLAAELERRGLSAGDVFNAMLAELAVAAEESEGNA